MFSFVDLGLERPFKREVPVIQEIASVNGKVIWIVLVVGGGGEVNDGGVVFILVVAIIG